MSVEDGFDRMQPSVNASHEAVTEARRRRDVFRRALPKAEDVVVVLPSGSFARGTQKDPIHDVDLVMECDSEEHPDWGQDGSSAEEALEHARNEISDLLGDGSGTEGNEVRLTSLQNHAVKCFLDDPDEERPYTVDVTPALRHPEAGFWIRSGSHRPGSERTPNT